MNNLQKTDESRKIGRAIARIAHRLQAENAHDRTNTDTEDN